MRGSDSKPVLMNVVICAVIARNKDHFETGTYRKEEEKFEPVGRLVVLKRSCVHYNLLDILSEAMGIEGIFMVTRVINIITGYVSI